MPIVVEKSSSGQCGSENKGRAETARPRDDPIEFRMPTPYLADQLP
jgi:hypothetical protein